MDGWNGQLLGRWGDDVDALCCVHPMDEYKVPNLGVTGTMAGDMAKW